ARQLALEGDGFARGKVPIVQMRDVHRHRLPSGKRRGSRSRVRGLRHRSVAALWGATLPQSLFDDFGGALGLGGGNVEVGAGPDGLRTRGVNEHTLVAQAGA